MILLLLPLLRLLPFLFSPLARPRTHPTDAQSSGRNSARSSRFPKSVACIIATCGGRPEPVQPVRYAWPPPSVRPPAGAPHLCAVGRMGPKQLTASPPTGCRQSHGLPWPVARASAVVNRVGWGRVERWRARGSVRWRIHSFRRGPQSGSHSDVSSAPPKMPCIEFSPARLQAKVCCHQPGPSRPDPELKCQVHIPSGASRFDLTFVVDVPPADYRWPYQPARLRLTAATTLAHAPFAPSGLSCPA